ncbi:hypothetical protein KKH18_03195, partial [bacterium]|nr:hypothetical protein [bacterium]
MACFRKIILIAIALLVLQPGCLIAAVRDLQPFPQQVQILGESPLKLSASLRIAVADYDSPPRWKSQKVPAWLLLQSELVSLLQKAGIPSPSFLDPESPDSETAELWIEIGEDTFVSDVMKRRGIIAGDSHETLEEYRISMEHYRIRIDATDILAAHWAVLTLMDLMRLESDSLYVNRVSVRDWPDFPVRVATINGSMRNETQIAAANRIADLAYYSKFNEIEWNSNDAGRKDEKQSSLAASLALRKKIERRAQRLSMSVDRTGYTVEQPEWQEAIPVIGTPLIAADSALLLDMESKQVRISNSSFEIVSDDRSTVPSWSPSTRNSAEWIKLDTLK